MGYNHAGYGRPHDECFRVHGDGIVNRYIDACAFRIASDLRIVILDERSFMTTYGQCDVYFFNCIVNYEQSVYSFTPRRKLYALGRALLKQSYRRML